MKNLTILILFAFTISFSLSAQQNISGNVNDYTSAVKINSGTQSVEVANATQFSIGDLALVIQMKGAKINESLSDQFGTIDSYNGAGNYELHRICRISGNELFFQNALMNQYEDNGSVQVIRVPEYSTGAKLTADLIGKSWDGSSGGVLVIKVNGTLNLNAFNIVMSGKGYRGGDALLSGGGCSFFSFNTEYSDKNSANDRALKGEGIAAFIAKKEASRGPQANGGGGGNNHNGGGAGGSNVGTGGAGGQRVKSTTLSCGSVVGLDSKPIIIGHAQSKIFMGGGGGAGHGNNAGFDGEQGQNGGGIVIILADTIIANGGSILCNGDTSLLNSENEGGGGGGAGGNVVLIVNEFISTLSVEAKGARGTNVDNFVNTNCSGPGGGGGGGAVLFSVVSISSAVTVSTIGGTSGKIASSSQSGCSVGNTNGAKSGTKGSTLIAYGFPDLSKMKAPTAMSVTGCNRYTSPSGKYVWTNSGNFADTILNRASCDSILDITLTIVPVDTSVAVEGTSLTSNATGVTYQWIDCSTKKAISGATQSQYNATYNGTFAVVVGTNGCFDTSSCNTIVGVGLENYLFNNIKIFPNPTQGKVHVDFPESIPEIIGRLYSVEGKTLLEFQKLNTNSIELNLNGPGIYILELEINYRIYRYRVVRE